MPRTGRRHSLSIAAALVAVLCAPAAAQAAATYTVKAGDGACAAPADLLCGSLTDAAAAAAVGDTFNVATGTYAESPTFDVGGVTITSPSSFALNGSIAFTGTGGGVSKLQHAVISQQNGSAAGVIATGTASLEIDDSFIVSFNGDGVSISEGAANKIVRTTVASGGVNTAAVRVTSADNAPNTKKLTLESALLSGGSAALAVITGNGNGLTTQAGDVDVTLRHVTAAGSSNGLVLDASNANPLIGGPVGSITATVTDSIIQNGTVKHNYAGILGPLTITAPPNTVTDTYTRTLMGAFDAGTVFQNPGAKNFRLKAGSPAINAGGFTAGESTTDIDGDARPGPQTDQGADEYVAPPPVVVPPPAPGTTTDGVPPAIVITKPTANQRIKLRKVTTKTTTKTVTRKGKKVKVKVKKKTSKAVRISFAGKATDPSGVKGVLLAVQRISLTPSKKKSTRSKARSAKASQATSTKCRWLNATKGIVLKSCSRPPLLLAKLGKDGVWTFSVNSKIHLRAGRYRIIAIGADNSGAFGNSAAAGDAIHKFTLTN